MLILSTNTNSRKDHFRNIFNQYAENEDLFLAAPFFTDSKPIEHAIKNNCNVKLIIRLCNVTSGVAISNIIKSPNIDIRFYTSNSFHSKLYIFGNSIAFVGSSNITDSAFLTNQEINIGIPSEDPIFDELITTFQDYWNYASPLTPEILKKFEAININTYEQENKYKKAIFDIIGKIEFPNIDRDVSKVSEEKLFYDTFLKKYQTFLSKYKILSDLYLEIGLRKLDSLPLRLEVDNLLNWIKEKKIKADSYKLSPVLKGDALLSNIKNHILEYHDHNDEKLDFLKDRYDELENIFSNSNNIESIQIDELYHSLTFINSFAAKERYFYIDGVSTLKERFIKENGENRIRNMFKYLFFGKENFAERIAKCIFDKNISLKHFKESAVKEIYGWINNDDIPLCNDRTLNSMQYLGFGKLS